ncbi:uncharacterized protein LOC107264627 [Cephus cinctus]|uniref:Uncharacterized protein LOC107264627 n=1 Tax=Cephus cinctus TaxID=211228 RepID=A0AAJ7BKS8_CEPCN|nr:uncharacterized protein LOC107264627 [Cephus cinctus]
MSNELHFQLVIAMSDILNPLPLEEWPLLRDIIKLESPAYTSYCNWISNAIIWKTKDPQVNLQIYCPHGKYNSGTFVGIFDHSLYNVVVFAFKSQGEILRKALRETRRLDFGKIIYFAFVLDDILPYLIGLLSDLKESRGAEILERIVGNYYYKSAKDAAAAEIRVPDECYLRPLKESDVAYIHSQWPHRDERNPETTLNYLKNLVIFNDECLGLCLKEDDTLVSWALVNDFHALAAVQTRKDYMRRGYAKLVSLAVAKCLGKQGFDSVLSILVGNTSSEKMFTSIGYQKITGSTWLIAKLCGNSEQ